MQFTDKNDEGGRGNVSEGRHGHCVISSSHSESVRLSVRKPRLSGLAKGRGLIFENDVQRVDDAGTVSDVSKHAR